MILAAGESSRLGRCKALLPLTPRTPLALLLEAGACFTGGPPLVITGADHDEIAAAAAGFGIEIWRNPDWRTGRTGSVRLAASLRPGRDLCIAPVDVPLVPRVVFEALLEAWDLSGRPARGWLAPRVTLPGAPGPRFGHPVLLGRELVLDLADMDAATPLSRLRERGRPVFSVEVEDPAILDDLDTPEDFQRLRTRSRG